MNSVTHRGWLLSSTILLGAVVSLTGFSGAAAAQQSTTADQGASPEVVVTGSRIRRAADDTTAPVTVVNQQDFADRGYINVGEALNDITANAASHPVALGSGAAVGNGQTYPNLFNLGAGRTLTLVDGRRFVTSTFGGDRIVDTNVIPTGLVDHIDVVEAGGAAVYGSDAIAGVVNYVLKKNFQGVEVDLQEGISTYGDQPQDSAHLTIGQNFNDNRGNIAFDAEWSKTDPLLYADRPQTASPRVTSGLTQIQPATFWEFDNQGVIFAPAPAPVPSFVKGQFSADGKSIASYNLGTVEGIPFSIGGQGESYGQLAALEDGIQRYSTTLLGHYDVTDHLKISGSLFYANTRSEDPYGAQASNTVLNSAASGAGYIVFTKNNPFLSAADISGIAAVDPAFGFGAPAFLSKFWTDLLPSRQETYSTDYYRGLISADGDFSVAKRNFYYSVSYSWAEASGDDQTWGVNVGNFNKAVNAVSAGGSIVCAINAVAVTDPACAALNPFGIGNVSPAARAYVSVPVGERFTNIQQDFLATIGGDVVKLPAGVSKFSLSYEHRSESADYDPDAANQEGLVNSGVPTVATSGSYSTNEYAGELLVPILGQGFNLPLARMVELSGQYRLVDNSLAGEESVWGAGLRWEVFKGFTFRLSRSRNFRAPTLSQLLAPSSTALGSLGGSDPCDDRYITQGANPATRLQNCQALFAAHPSWGPLATFQDPSVNFANAEITTGGNPDLKNEVSNTTTFGLVYHPDWVPGNLNLQVDRIQIDLENGITALQPYQFLSACYDSPTANNAACSQFVRDPGTGYVTSAASTTYNAAAVQYHGENINLDYRFPVS